MVNSEMPISLNPNPSNGFDSGGSIVWRPSPELIGQSNLQHFMSAHGLQSLNELQRRSTTDISWFWNAVLGDLDIRFRRNYSRVLDPSRGRPWTQWCVDGVMNIVNNCLDKYAGTTTGGKTAVRWEGEEGEGKKRRAEGFLRCVEMTGKGMGKGKARQGGKAGSLLRSG